MVGPQRKGGGEEFSSSHNFSHSTNNDCAAAVATRPWAQGHLRESHLGPQGALFLVGRQDNKEGTNNSNSNSRRWEEELKKIEQVCVGMRRGRDLISDGLGGSGT